MQQEEATRITKAEGSGARKRTDWLPPNVVWLSVASMFNDVSGEIVTRALPLFLVGALGVNKALIGLIEGIAETTASLLKVISGWYSDRWGSRRNVAGAGYALTGIARPVLFFTTGWVLPLFSKFVDRIGKGIRTAPRDALIADSVPASERGRAFGFHRALDPLGAVIGALVAAGLLYFWTGVPSPVITEAQWKTLMIVAAVPTFISVAIVFLLVHEKRVRTTEPPPQSRIFHVGSDNRFRRLLMVLVFFTLSASSDAFVLLRAQSLGMSVWEIFLLVALFNLVTTVSAYPAGVISDRLSRKSMIRAGWVLYAAIYFGFGFATQLWQIWVLYLAYGGYYGLTEGVEKAFVADLVRPEERGAAYGLYNGAIGITVLPASVIAGVLWQAIGAAAPFLFAGVIAIIAALLLGFIPEGPRVYDPGTVQV